MKGNDMEHKNKKSWWKTPFGMACTAIFLIALFVLIQDHAAHIGNYWIWLILLACPLVHIFMHGHHHKRTNNEKEKDDEPQERS
jgi:amino acid transporter